MSLTSGDLKVGHLMWRVWEENPRHVKVHVFDQGAKAGELVLDRATYEAIAGQPTGESVPLEIVPLTPLERREAVDGHA